MFIVIIPNWLINIQNGCTPLYLASSKGHVAVVRLLIKRNADVTICTKVLPILSSFKIVLLKYFLLTNKQDGLTPRYAASWIGQRDIVDLLIKAGADTHLASTEVGQIQHLQSLDTCIIIVCRCSSGDCSSDGTCPTCGEAVAGKSQYKLPKQGDVVVYSHNVIIQVEKSFSEMKGDVGMSPHEKEREQEDAHPDRKSSNPIPTSLFSL